MASHSVVDYSKWDHLDTDSSEDEAPPPPPPRTTLASARAPRTSEPPPPEDGGGGYAPGMRRLERLHSTPALAAAAAGVAEEDWRDWGNRFGEGLPAEVLEKVAQTLVAQTEAAWLKEESILGLLRAFWTEERLQEEIDKRKREGNCLFVFARVCKEWRKAQLKVGGPLRTRVRSDVIMPGSVALVKWALAEGCPREGGDATTMADYAAEHGNLLLVQWLCGKGGFAMDVGVMEHAAHGGNLELVQWLRAEGCPWDQDTCFRAVERGHVETLRWARENGCPWDPEDRDRAAAELGYTDDFGNLVYMYDNY